jgi:hypothetical protein
MTLVCLSLLQVALSRGDMPLFYSVRRVVLVPLWSHHILYILYVCMYILCKCLFINIINVHIRASILRWPELFGQGPRAVRQGHSNCETWRRACRAARSKYSQRMWIERNGCARYIFSFLLIQRLIRFLPL